MLITTITLYEAIDAITTKNYQTLIKVLKNKGIFIDSYICVEKKDRDFKLFVKLELDKKYIHLSEQIKKETFIKLVSKRLEEIIYDY